MPDRVHPPVHSVQPTNAQSVGNLGLAEADPPKLTEGDHAVLPCGDEGDRRVR